MKALTISLIVLSVLIGAIADGFNQRGFKVLGHLLEAAEKPALLLAGLFSGTWIVLIPYVAYRVALFDITRNLAKGDPIFYMGTSSIWDRVVGKWNRWGVLFGRVIFLIFAISVSILEL